MKRTIAAGQQFGRWTALEPGRRPFYWLCACSCGSRKDVAVGSLNRGDALDRLAQENARLGLDYATPMAAAGCEWTNCPRRVGDVCCNDRLAQDAEPVAVTTLAQLAAMESNYQRSITAMHPDFAAQAEREDYVPLYRAPLRAVPVTGRMVEAACKAFNLYPRQRHVAMRAAIEAALAAKGE